MVEIFTLKYVKGLSNLETMPKTMSKFGQAKLGLNLVLFE